MQKPGFQQPSNLLQNNDVDSRDLCSIPKQCSETIASIKLLIVIGKQGRRTVDNQSRSVLQPFNNVLIKTMALMTLAKSTNTSCVQAWHVYWSLFAVYRHDAHNGR